MFRVLTLGALVISLSACASGALRQSAEGFGNQTKAAVAAFETATNEQVREATITTRVSLAVSAGCDDLLIEPSKEAATACTIEPIGDPAIVDSLKRENAPQLAAKLGTYAEAIGKLAGDFSGQNEALLTSLTNAGTAVVNLQAAITQVDPSQSDLDRSSGVTDIIAQALSLGLQVRRDRVLKKIIRDTDETVQEATKLLSAINTRVRNARVGFAHQELIAAEVAYENVRATGSQEARRKAYTKLEEKLSTFRALASAGEQFAQIGAAHAKLKKAINSGFSNADIKAYITTLIALSDSVKALNEADAT